jgi:hypothetical protein
VTTSSSSAVAAKRLESLSVPIKSSRPHRPHQRVGLLAATKLFLLHNTSINRQSANPLYRQLADPCGKRKSSRLPDATVSLESDLGGQRGRGRRASLVRDSRVILEKDQIYREIDDPRRSSSCSLTMSPYLDIEIHTGPSHILLVDCVISDRPFPR